MTFPIKRPKLKDLECKLVVIGAGPSGITIAKEIKINGFEVYLFGSHYESQIAKAGPLRDVNLVEEGTIGLDQIEKMVTEAKNIGVFHKTSNVISIKTTEYPYLVKTKYQDIITENIIIATGAKQAKLGFKGEERFLHKGISDCAVCDWGLFRGNNIGVIGNHEYTIRAAQFMKSSTKLVSLFWLDETINFEDPEIDVYSNIKDIEAYGNETLEGVRFMSNSQKYDIELSGLFVEGRPLPSTEFLNGSGIDLDNNYIKVNDEFKTSKDHIWAVGDVCGNSKSFDEAIIEAKKAIKFILDDL